MEKVHIKRRRSQAKVAGTIVTVVGAVLMILYKGPVVEFFWNKGRTRHESDSSGTNTHHWLMGVFMLLFSCFCWSAFFLVQVSCFKLPILMYNVETCVHMSKIWLPIKNLMLYVFSSRVVGIY